MHSIAIENAFQIIFSVLCFFSSRNPSKFEKPKAIALCFFLKVAVLEQSLRAYTWFLSN